MDVTKYSAATALIVAFSLPVPVSADLKTKQLRSIVRQEIARVVTKGGGIGPPGPQGPQGPAGPPGAPGNPALASGTPLRFARILATGEVDAQLSEGVTQQDVHVNHSLGEPPGRGVTFYCITVSPPANGAQVTTEFNVGIPDAQITSVDPLTGGFCVSLLDSIGRPDEGNFYVLIY